MLVGFLVFGLGAQMFLEAHAPLPESVEKRLKHPAHEIRQQALAGLHCQRNPHEVHALERGLRDPEVTVRWQALMGLAECQEKEAIAALQEAASDPSYLLRIAVVEAAMGWRGSKIASVLRQLLHDRHPHVQIYATVAFVQKAYVSASLLLQKRLRAEASHPERLLVFLVASENLRATRAIPWLSGLLSSRHRPIQARSILTLALLLLPTDPQRPRFLQKIRSFLRHPSPELRASALVALALSRQAQDEANLRKLLREGPQDLAICAVFALRVFPLQRIRPFLFLASQSPWPQVAALAKAALSDASLRRQEPPLGLGE